MKENLPIQLDFRSGVPIYLQIMDQVTRMIAAQQLNPGDQLPTVRQLAADLRVNFNTVARAYKLLDEAGTISTQHGRGTYILAPDPESTPAKPSQKALHQLTRQYLGEARRLGFTLAEVQQVLDPYLRSWQDEEAPMDEQQNQNLEE